VRYRCAKESFIYDKKCLIFSPGQAISFFSFFSFSKTTKLKLF